MNVSPISCRVNSLNYKPNNKVNNRTVSFQGKLELVKDVKEASGSWGGCMAVLAGIVLVVIPHLVKSWIKPDKIQSVDVNDVNKMTDEKAYKTVNQSIENIKSFYKITRFNMITDNPCGILSENAVSVDRVMRKYGDNNYTRFVKEATHFLANNCVKSRTISYFHGECVYFGNNIAKETKDPQFIKFVNAIKLSAQAAILKNTQNIDFDSLNKDIEEARELIQSVK